MVTRLKQFNNLIVTRLGTNSSYKVVRIVVEDPKVETRNMELFLKKASKRKKFWRKNFVLNLRDNPP